MSINPPIPEKKLFENLTLKIQSQGHVWGQSSKSLSGSNFLSIHIPFIPCQLALPFLEILLIQNLTLKIQGQGHGWGERWKLAQHPVEVFPYCFTSIGPTIPMIWLIVCFTAKKFQTEFLQNEPRSKAWLSNMLPSYAVIGWVVLNFWWGQDKVLSVSVAAWPWLKVWSTWPPKKFPKHIYQWCDIWRE